MANENDIALVKLEDFNLHKDNPVIDHPDGSIGENKLDNALKTKLNNKLDNANNIIQTNHIADQNITNSKLKDNDITSSKIQALNADKVLITLGGVQKSLQYLIDNKRITISPPPKTFVYQQGFNVGSGADWFLVNSTWNDKAVLTPDTINQTITIKAVGATGLRSSSAIATTKIKDTNGFLYVDVDLSLNTFFNGELHFLNGAKSMGIQLIFEVTSYDTVLVYNQTSSTVKTLLGEVPENEFSRLRLTGYFGTQFSPYFRLSATDLNEQQVHFDKEITARGLSTTNPYVNYVEFCLTNNSVANSQSMVIKKLDVYQYIEV